MKDLIKDRPEEVLCPQCGGFMKVPCPMCNGVGCKACLGKGQFDCPNCQGRGMVPKDRDKHPARVLPVEIDFGK